MPTDFKPGCARPTGGPAETTEQIYVPETPLKENTKEISMIRVGKKAPDFTAPAYIKGKFASVELSEYLGKWVLLCFYPGDFTFV